MNKFFFLFVLIYVNSFAASNCSLYFEEFNRLQQELKQPQVTSFSDSHIDKINLLHRMLSLKGYSFVESTKDARYELTFSTGEDRDIQNYRVTYAGVYLKQIDNGQIFSFGDRSTTKLFHGPMKQYPLLFSVAFDIKSCQQ